ncbi:hypothetical protein [Streptomyces sp. NBC_00096]|uniref:hypothetical protein n=1 Tax=Streptomyces sp. NBC_00096 TaxID=2975650 RepID=UPI00324A7390
MSTPEEQQRQERQRQQERQQQEQQQPDPYGTQTWQSPTWDTSYQPVQAPLGGVPAQYPAEYPGEYPAAPAPAQPLAPEGWFREEPQARAQAQPPAAAPGQEWAQQPYADPYAAPARPQVSAPDHWFREEPQGEPAPQWGETAYPPPYPGPADPLQGQEQGQEQGQGPAAAPAPGQEWAEPAAYLPQQAAEFPAPAPAAAAAPAPAPMSAGAPDPVAGEPAAEEEPAWSPPTLAGNTLRAVDPAQARAEGRSPIIDPGPQAAILTAALGLVLAAAAWLGELALLAPLIALQGLTAAGWFRLNGMWPARQGIVLAFAGALVADVAVLAVDEAYGPGAIVGTLGAWVLLTLVLQLRSHAEPDERMYGLMASVASAALAIVCAGYLAADAAAASVGAAAVAVAVFARALPLPTAPSVGVSLAAAAGAGIAVGGLTSVGAGGALIGLAAGVCALIGLRVAAYDYPSKFVHMTAGVALPLAAAAPAVYLIGRVVG